MTVMTNVYWVLSRNLLFENLLSSYYVSGTAMDTGNTASPWSLHFGGGDATLGPMSYSS